MIWTGQAPCETSPRSVTTTFEVYLAQLSAGSFDHVRSYGYSLEDVRRHVLSSNGILGDTFLVTAHLRVSLDIAVPAISPRETLTSVRTCRVRLLILLRPSETTQTTTFFQPSGPHIFDLFLLHRCATFLSTLRAKFQLSDNVR